MTIFMDKSCKLIYVSKLWPLMVPFHALQTKPWIECWLFFIGESILIFKQYPYATGSLDETVYKPNIRIFFFRFCKLFLISRFEFQLTILPQKKWPEIHIFSSLCQMVKKILQQNLAFQLIGNIHHSPNDLW